MSVHALKEPEKKVPSREDFLSHVKTNKTRTIPVAGLGEVTIKGISLKAREEIKSGATDHLGRTNDAMFIALTVVKGLVEPQLTPQDVAALQESAFGELNELSNRIWELSGISKDAADKAKNA